MYTAASHGGYNFNNNNCGGILTQSSLVIWLLIYFILYINSIILLPLQVVQKHSKSSDYVEVSDADHFNLVEQIDQPDYSLTKVCGCKDSNGLPEQ